MHVFIDTNIFLNFYHFTDEDLDTLNNVFAEHKFGSATVYVTQQVKDEFTRNRDSKIKDAIKRFQEAKFNVQIPIFMKGFPEYDLIKRQSSELQKSTKALLDRVKTKIENKELLADSLIGTIFANSQILKTTEKIFGAAIKRGRLGNPPGKLDSLGDAINWETLLSVVPEQNDLHIVSADGDYYSTLHDTKPNTFLRDEWKERKNSNIYVYRNLSKFLNEHFDGIAFSYDIDKDRAIEALNNCGSFSSTHVAISKLEKFPYFSTREVKKILSACAENRQISMIITDDDIADFLSRICEPKMAEINEPEFLTLMNRIAKSKLENEENGDLDF